MSQFFQSVRPQLFKKPYLPQYVTEKISWHSLSSEYSYARKK